MHRLSSQFGGRFAAKSFGADDGANSTRPRKQQIIPTISMACRMHKPFPVSSWGLHPLLFSFSQVNKNGKIKKN